MIRKHKIASFLKGMGELDMLLNKRREMNEGYRISNIFTKKFRRNIRIARSTLPKT
jgi:hypothetical protein